MSLQPMRPGIGQTQLLSPVVTGKTDQDLYTSVLSRLLHCCFMLPLFWPFKIKAVQPQLQPSEQMLHCNGFSSTSVSSLFCHFLPRYPAM